MRRERETWPHDPRTPNLRWDRDRHGNARCYHRDPDFPGSKNERLRAPFGSDAFVAEYQAAAAAVAAGTAVKVERTAKWRRPSDQPDVGKKGGVDSLNYLFGRYHESPAFLRGLGASTRQEALRLTDRLCARDFASAALGKVKLGELPYARLEQDFVEDLRDDFIDTPGTAREVVKVFRRAFKWALGRKKAFPGLTHNPAAAVALPSLANPDGLRQWTDGDIEKYLAAYPEGAKRAWAIVLLNTGLRRSDAIRASDDMVFDGIDAEGNRCKMLALTPVKGRERKERAGKEPVTVTIPLLPELLACLAARPAGQTHWIVSKRGKPYRSVRAFTAALREAAADAGAPNCSPHGLRKAAAAYAASNGATHAELMAIFGWETMTMPDKYIRKFSRQRTAVRSMHLVARPPASGGSGTTVPLGVVARVSNG